MLQVILPVACVDAAIGKFKDSVTVLKVCFEASLVRAAIRVCDFAPARTLSVLPAALVCALVGPDILTLALTHVFVEVSFIHGSITPPHEALTMAFVILPLALVSGSILEHHLATTVLLVIAPLSCVG